jgi:chorismate mutase/prephenate dehydratase
MADKENLEAIRARIDDIDNRLLELISDRANCAQEVAKIKQKDNPGEVNFYRPEREAQILKRIVDTNPGPLNGNDVKRLFREIISTCLSLEQSMDIAFLGPEGTFTQAATYKHFGQAINVLPCSSISQVFEKVNAGDARYGVVPIENSIEGVVNQTHDLLINSDLNINGEVQLPVVQNLIGTMSSINEIKKVYSHQQSLAQCREWLDENLGEIERSAVTSNALAASLAKEEQTSAAIAGESAAELYDLNIIARNIQGDLNNTTRFLVIGKDEIQPGGDDKTSLIFTTPNKPGSLHRALACFAENNVSMMRIESRPSRDVMWDYVFFVDIQGHRDEESVSKAIEALQTEVSMLKILGSYPQSTG